MIGHNQPPPLEAMSLHVEDLFALTSATLAGGPVTTDEQEAALDGLLDELRAAKKLADAQRAADKKPILDAGKAIDAAWKPLLDRCDMGAEGIKMALTPYRTARQQAKDEAARQARAEADAKLAEAQAALKQSDDLEERFAAEEQLKQAAKLTAQANRIDRSATGLRSHQVAEVTNPGELLKHIKLHDPQALLDWLADYARKALPAQLPGVTIRIERKAA
jgi:DNA repair exonuclease SbcCD ATPase subunit